MLKQKTTIAMQWILRLICGTAMGLLVICFQGDLPLRAALGQSQDGPPVVITTVDPDATFYATFQSHNQKVVANSYGIFMTYLHKQECCDSNGNCCNVNDPLCFDDTRFAQRCIDASKDIISTWRLLRSVNGGATFTTIDNGRHGTTPPVLETDWQGNIYLAYADYFMGGQNAYLTRYLASDNFQNPTSTTLTGGAGEKFAMEIDEARGQLYFFSDTNSINGNYSIINKFFRVRLSDLAILAEYPLTQDGTNANMHYPHLYLDDNGHLYAAWTTVRTPAAWERLKTQCGNEHSYWSIHFMRSLDGGVTWARPHGQRLDPPIIADETADETGKTDEITPVDERCADTWLSTFLVKGGKAHFVYNAGDPVYKQHYVRYDLATARIDLNVVPFKGDNISIANLDGVCSTRRSIKEIFCVSMSNHRGPDSRIVVLKSEDNGLTWRDHALGPLSKTYSLGGSPQVTYDGYIIGSYTESLNFDDQTAQRLVKFFKVASLAEPSRKDVVFTAGDLELTGTEQDFDEFLSGAAIPPTPTYVVGQSGLDHVRHYIGYSYADPTGGNKAQFLQFNNLVVGKQYTLYVQPSSIAGDANCFFASAESGAVIFEGGCKWWWPSNPINRTSDAWKVVFNATAPSATIRLGNFFDASNSGGVSRYIYIDAIYSMIGDLELSGNPQIDYNEFTEFTGAFIPPTPTYVVGQSGLDHVRHYIGYSYADPSGGNKAQYLQLTNLTVGRNYTVDVYPSGNYGDANCYYATAISGGTVVSGDCRWWPTIGQFQSIANRWRIVVRAESQTMTLRIGNFRDASNSEGVSRFIYIDAIGLQSN